jgi:cytochrome c biogenesis protein CcdA
MNSAVSGSSKINKFNPQNYKGFKKFVDKDAWWVLILVGSLFMLFMVPLILGLKVFFDFKSKKKGFWISFKEGVKKFCCAFIFMLLHHGPDVSGINWKNLVDKYNIRFIICYLYIPIILSLIPGFLLRALNDSQKQNKNNKYKTKNLLISFWVFFFVLVVYLLFWCFCMAMFVDIDKLVVITKINPNIGSI